MEGNIGIELLLSNRQTFKPMQGNIGIEILISGVKVIVVQDEQANTLFGIPVLIEDINEVDPPQMLYTNSKGYIYIGSEYSTDIRATIVDQPLWLDEVAELDTSVGDYHVVTLIKAWYYRVKVAGGVYSNIIKSRRL